MTTNDSCHFSDHCLSYVGMIGGEQELVLGQSCFTFGVLVHELMHTLGFYHEHCRPDRDDYLDVFYENIQESKRQNFAVIPSKNYRMVTYFDYDSIMIYGETAFSKNGYLTMRARDSYYRLTNPDKKNHLSSSDIYALRFHYHCL